MIHWKLKDKRGTLSPLSRAVLDVLTRKPEPPVIVKSPSRLNGAVCAIILLHIIRSLSPESTASAADCTGA